MDNKKQVQINRGTLLDVLKIALPLILASGCHALNMFIDRLMLTRYSQASAAASFSGGLTNFTVACFFVGVIGYTGTFVAQYAGAKQYNRIGITVWQGFFLALASGLLVATGILWAKPFFSIFSHAPEVLEQEICYFRVLSGGVVVFLSSCAFSCFWTGRGYTKMVLAISATVVLCNVPLNYLLIYGRGVIPEMGIAGAGLGTIFSEFIGLCIYITFFLSRPYRLRFNTARIVFDWDLIKRMLYYGVPNGVQLFLDMVAFNTFCIMLGYYGVAVHEAAGIAFGINNIAFCPVLGIGQTAAVLVGQAIGAGDVKLAHKSVLSAFILITIYSLGMIVLFSGFQDLVLAPFVRAGDTAQLESLEIAKKMLLFICAYLLFDGGNIVLSNALRGAGDTRFTMWVFGIFGVLFFAVPCVVMCVSGCPWWALWVALDGYILLLSVIFYSRYRQGKWEKMKVIEAI